MNKETFLGMVDGYLNGGLSDAQIEVFEEQLLVNHKFQAILNQQKLINAALTKFLRIASEREFADLMSGGFPGDEEDKTNTIPVDIQSMIQQLAPIASVSIDLGGVWRSRGAGSEDGLPQYKAGEELMLGLTMPWTGHLMVFMQGPDGLQIICPGPGNTQTSYEKDASPVLSMNAAKDPGVYLLKAIAVPQEEVVIIGLELDSNGQLPLGIENAAQILGRLDQTKLSISEVRFEIVPKEG